MNELAARKAIKQLLVNNKDVFVDGLVFQGNPREIHQITMSQLTPPTGYYFINIYVSNVRDTNNSIFKNAAKPPTISEYDINIEISDYAVGDYYTEDQLFERMDGDFQLFTDRIVAKLRETMYITDIDSGISFTILDGKNIIKNNLSSTWEEATEYHAILYSRINFTLVDNCNDDSTLYD